MPKAVILPMFFCVMRLYIVTKIRELELSLPGQETSSENDLMMIWVGGVQNLVTIPDDTISGWRSR